MKKTKKNNKTVEHLMPIEDGIKEAAEQYMQSLLVEVNEGRMTSLDAMFEVYQMGFSHGGDVVISLFQGAE